MALDRKGFKALPSTGHRQRTPGGENLATRSEGAKERGREGMGMALMNVMSQGS